MVALTLIQAYVLVGSTYLILKTTGELQATHYKTAKLAAWTTLAGAVFITVSTPVFSEQLREHLLEPPLLYIFGIIPILGSVLVGLLLRSLYREEENTPIIWTFMLFALSFIGLGFVIFPQIIPPSVTIYEAAAAPQFSGVYAHVYWVLDSNFAVLQHLQLHRISGAKLPTRTMVKSS